jgi:DNA-binding IclR family transcriptional regulator
MPLLFFGILMKKKEPQRKFKANTLDRGLDLLEILARQSSEKSLTELSELAGFNLATTHRIINVLKSRGYVRKSLSGSKYRLGLNLFELGQKAIKDFSLREEAKPILNELAVKTNETVYLLVIDHGKPLCLRKVESPNYIKVLLIEEGERMDFHVGAAPRVLLAYLPDDHIDKIIKENGLRPWTDKSIIDPQVLKKTLVEIREQGYVLSMEDVTKDAAALGVPVRNRSGEVVAAISVSGLAIHFKGDNLKKIIDAVKGAANELSEKIVV